MIEILDARYHGEGDLLSNGLLLLRRATPVPDQQALSPAEVAALRRAVEAAGLGRDDEDRIAEAAAKAASARRARRRAIMLGTVIAALGLDAVIFVSWLGYHWTDKRTSALIMLATYVPTIVIARHLALRFVEQRHPSRAMYGYAYGPVEAAVDALVACDIALRTPSIRLSSLGLLRLYCRKLERALLAPRDRPFGLSDWLEGRRRRERLKNHATRVIGGLREVADQLDVSPDMALGELRGMLITLADNCTKLRFGALLPEEQLADVTPARDWERLWFIGVWLISLPLAWGLTTAGLPQPLDKLAPAGALWLPFVARFGVERGFGLSAQARGEAARNAE
ncbi:hypothetical protein ACPC54_05045 [Kitasatospora sp. NPDC094028]